MTSMSPYPVYPAGPVEPYVMQIGDIGVTRSWVVTPRGTASLAGSEWFTTGRSSYTSAIPVWAIVLAILFFPLGLLFLLVKETRPAMWVEVTVRSGPLTHVVAIPATPTGASVAYSQVAQVQELARYAAG